MAKQRVVILGSGVGSLVTAYYLTLPEMNDAYDVTIVQMGWRLGGKGASSRCTEYAARNIEEHGLHIWLGCYDNAFSTIRRVYGDLEGQPGILPGWTAALKPKPYTPVGLGAGREFLQFFWPPNSIEPGSATSTPISITAIIEDLLGLVKELLANLITHVISSAGDAAEEMKIATADVHRIASEAHAHAALIGDHPETDHPATDHPATEGVIGHIVSLLHAAKVKFERVHDPKVAGSNPIWQLLNITHACMHGIVNPKYGILEDGDLDRIDDYEFCAWLLENGASPDVADPTLDKEPFLRSFYDLGFFYRIDGDVLTPDCGAGTALRCLIRIAALYKGAGLYEMQAGMGEAVIMPLYHILTKRGVKFEFFRKVENVEVDVETMTVKGIELTVQATVANAPYRPTMRVGALDCWPDQPDWSQLVDGEKLKASGVNFESHWLDGDARETTTLVHGRDFDTVVLGIALGALQKLNGEPSIVQEVIDASPRFATMAETLGVIPTFAVQIWSKKTLQQLGWNPRLPDGYTVQSPAGVGLVEPLDVWADMTHLIPLEQWPSGDAPQSLHYFCGPLRSNLYREPSTNRAVPQEANAVIQATTRKWFDDCTSTIWPLACTPGGGLDPAVLYDTTGAGKAVDLDSQYFRANIDPTECCTGSMTGTTKYRLRAHESGLGNLFLTGAWTRTGYNTECVEGATMSGMAAARAVSGAPESVINIVGEYFLQSK